MKTLIPELAPKIILALFLIFVLGKVLSVVLQDFWSRVLGGDKRKGHDIDQMIRAKKNEFSMGMALAQKESHAPSGPADSPPPTPSTARAYQEAFQKASAGGHTSKDGLKKVLELFDQMQWGDVAAFRPLEEAQGLPTGSASKLFKEMLKANTLLSLKRPNLPLLPEIMNGLEIFLWLEKQRNQAEPTHLRPYLAFKHKALSTDGKIHDSKAFTKLLQSTTSVLQGQAQKSAQEEMAWWLTVAASPKGDHFRSLDEVEGEFEKARHFFEIFRPLPLVDAHDRQGALALMQLEGETSWETIKKQYKGLALQFHPDRIQGTGIGEHEKELLTENFVRLQHAYDILKKFYH